MANLNLFDTPHYPQDHPCHSNASKKVVGVYMDETCGRQIKEFVGFRAKYYLLLLADDAEKSVARSVPRVSIELRLWHLNIASTFRTVAEHTM